MFEQTHFLVILTNFRGVEFFEFAYPLIFRTVQPVWLRKYYEPAERWFKTSATYVTKEALLKSNVSETFACGFFASVHINKTREICGVLNMSSYWRQSRPWSNTASITLFPHMSLYKKFSSIEFVDITNPSKNRYSFIPTAIPPIKILVVYPSEMKSMEQITKLIGFLGISVTERNQYSSFGKFYLVRTTFSASKFSSGENINNILIRNLSTIQICRRNAQLYLNLIPHNDWNVISNFTEMTKVVSSVLCDGTPQMNKLLADYHFLNFDKVDLINSLEHALGKCPDATTTNPIVGSSKVKNISEGYASVWLSVIGNFSYVAPTDHICDEGILIPAKHYHTMLDIAIKITSTFIDIEQSGTIYPAVLASGYNDLRFITCGYRGLEQLFFGELVIVFEERVWIVLFTFICILSVILQ